MTTGGGNITGFYHLSRKAPHGSYDIILGANELRLSKSTVKLVFLVNATSKSM